MPEDAPLQRVLRFVNGRFEDDGVHLSGVAELGRYQRLISAIANDIWIETHGRPMPSRISKFFELRLREIGEGSFVAEISPVEEAIQTEDVQGTIELADARVNALFESITVGLRPDFEMSHETKVALNKFGSSFRGAEGLRIENLAEPLVYGVDQRAWVKQMLKEPTTPISGVLLGKVFALNVDAKSFMLELPDGRDVPGSYHDEARWEDIRSLLDLPASRTLIRLVCSYEALLSGEPVRVKDVEAVDVFSNEADPFTDRFAELAALNPGWLDSHGARIEVAAIEMARDILAALPATRLQPSLFPTPDGGVQIEWLTDSQHIELIISPDIELSAHSYDARSRESYEATPVGAAEAARFVTEVLDAR